MIINIRIVEYNNKSRKGTYVRVHETGKPFRQFKYDETIALDYYREAYKNNWTGKQEKEKQQEWKEQRGDIQRYIKELTQKRSITRQLKEGTTIRKNDLQQLGNPKKVDYEYRKLLEPLVLDKELLGVIIQNKNKLKHRLAHGITIYGTTKKTGNVETILAHINDIGNRTLEEVYNDYTNLGIKKGETISYGKTPETLTKLRIGPKTGKQYNEGKISRIEVITTFQKGK